MTPWYRGFTGDIVCVDGKWFSLGKFTRKSPASLEITELPIGTWTEQYKDHLESLVGNVIKSYENQCTDTAVKFLLRFGSSSDVDALLISDGDSSSFNKAYSVLKLTSQKGLGVSNIHLFGERCAIRKYADTTAILREHFDVRLKAYVKRKAYLDAALAAELVVLNSKARFVREVISGDIKLLGIKNADLDAVLQEREYPRVDDNYGYLTRLPVSTLTAERASALDEEERRKGLDLAELRATSERDLWLKELAQFEAALV